VPGVPSPQLRGFLLHLHILYRLKGGPIRFFFGRFFFSHALFFGQSLLSTRPGACLGPLEQ